MNKYAQHYFNSYLNKMAGYQDGFTLSPPPPDYPYDPDYNSLSGLDKVDENLNAKEYFDNNLSGNNTEGQEIAKQYTNDKGPFNTPLPMSEMDPNNPAPSALAPANVGIKSLKDRWSDFHGKGPKNAYNPNSKRDVAMLKAMEAAQSGGGLAAPGGERAIRAAANGPLSRPAMKQPRR